MPIGMDQPIFRATAEPGDRRAGQPLAEILWEGPAQVCPPGLDPSNPPTFKDSGKPADGGFNFGKFRHGGDMADCLQPR